MNIKTIVHIRNISIIAFIIIWIVNAILNYSIKYNKYNKKDTNKYLKLSYDISTGMFVTSSIALSIITIIYLVKRFS